MSDLQRILWQRLNADATRALGDDWIKKKIILYGAGGLGASFLETFPQINVSYFVDTDPARDQSEFQGLPVHTPERLRRENPEEIVVFITSSWHKEICLTLQSLGLVLNQHFYYGTQKAHGRIFFYLPQMSDFEKAFAWFEQRDASYSILRWFDSLPTQVPEDIHILFETEDLELLFENPYLTSEPEGIQLEIYWSRPLGQEDELLTYPTWLGHEILSSRTKGPYGAFVPLPEVYLKSLAYHVVFHKAENAKLPVDSKEQKCPTSNKYSRQLSELADALDAPLAVTLEGLWDYLDSVGWLPPIDLARRYASDLNSPWLSTKAGSATGAEEDILVFVFREWLIERPEVLDFVVNEIENFGLEKITIIEFNPAEKTRAYEQIRGGNWIESPGSRAGGGPATLGIFRDPNPRAPSAQDRLLRPFCTNQKLTLKTELKQRICERFNGGELVNFLHAADDMREGYEYVDCLTAARRDTVHTAIGRASVPDQAMKNSKRRKAGAKKAQTFVVYGAGANQVPVLEACRRRGWTVFAVDRNPDAPGAAIADRFLCASLRDHDQITSALRKDRIRGVAARVTDRSALESSQRLSAEREIASACPALVAASTSKVALASVCRRAGLQTPRRYGKGEMIDWPSGPVIIRPDVTLRGKAGIYRVADQSELDCRWSLAETASGNGEVDVSEWIDGVDISVLAQLDAGVARRIAIWDEWVALDSQGCISGVGAGFPSVFEGKFDEIDATLDALAKAFAESRCLVTLSLRIDGSGNAWIIEIHLGLGGDGLADQLIPAALPGFDAFDALVGVCAGERQEPPEASPRPRGLVRGESGWVLIEASDAASLRARGRERIPKGWELPAGLREQTKAHGTLP